MDEAVAIDFDRLIKRRLAWDMLPCTEVPEYLPLLGLIPGSQEGNELEHASSHQRLNLLAPVDHVVKTYGNLAGEVIGRAMIENHELAGDDTDTVSLYFTACLQAVIANLIDTNILHVNEGYDL